jgi:GPH family glycoside/pentoside/hexuronide:cation symporter
MIEVQHSKRIMVSYNIAAFVSDLLGAILAVMLFAFYETEVGLSTSLTGIALIIFAIWDAINDTIVGYISDRPNRFTKRWGRRFPLVVGSFIPMIFLFLLIFYPPLGASQWLIFGWLVITTCIFDTVESIFLINFFGLFPDKFRSESERVTASAIGTYFTIFGVVVGGLVPPMIIVFGNIDSYVLMAWITVAASLMCYPLFIPGMRDDRVAVDQFIENYEKGESVSFLRALSTTLKHKNFAAYLLLLLTYFTLSNSLSSSMFYYARYVLVAEATIVMLFMVAMFSGALVGVILWLLYIRRTHNTRGVMIYGGVIMVIAAMVFSFIPGTISIMVTLFVLGIGLGGVLTMLSPIFGDVVDESVLQTQQRNEGLFSGVRFFMTNLSRVLMSIIFTVVHELTGFIEASEIQPSSAIFGIKLHSGFIPGVFMLVGVLVFWKYYDITPDRAHQIKERLKELAL